jgi:site-specific recombinase XerD
MIYLTKEELRRLFCVAYQHDRRHHLSLVVCLFSGLRVSELLKIRGHDVSDGQLSVKRLKGSRKTVHPIRKDADVLFDATPLLELAAANPNERLFPWTRQWVDQYIKKYAALAGIHKDKAHSHVLKHSICVLVWDATRDLSAVQDLVGHKASSSTLVYMRHDAVEKAHAAVAGMIFTPASEAIEVGSGNGEVN